MPDSAHNFSAAALSRSIETNILDYHAHFSQLPHAELHDTPSIRWLATGIPDGDLNVVLQAQLAPADCDAQIARMIAEFQRRQLPFSWHIGPSSPPANLGERLLHHGLTLSDDEPGMAIDLHAITADVPTPSGLTFHPVNNMADLREWVGIWLFPGELELVRERYVTVLGALGFAADRPLRHYIGKRNGTPVATIALFSGAGVVAVHHGVTHRDARRQGIGAAMTQMALHEARAHGWHIAVLTASSMGYNIYYRLGFRTYCRMSIYGWKPA